MSAPMPTSSQAAYTLGPSLIGTCIALLLQGVVSTQLVTYFTTWNRDPLFVRAYVGVLAVLTTLGAILDFLVLWRKHIMHFGTINLPDNTEGDVVAILVAVVVIYVQGYYLHRLFLLSNRNFFIVVIIGCILVVGFLMNIVANSYSLQGGFAVAKQVNLYYDIHFPLVLTGDVLLTLCTTAYLLHFRKNVLPQNTGILTTLIRVTFQTAAPATCCIIINFAISVAFPVPVAAPLARIFASIGVNILLPKLWAISVLWTLNARADRDNRSRSRGGWRSSNVYVSNMNQSQNTRAQTEVVRDEGSEVGASQTGMTFSPRRQLAASTLDASSSLKPKSPSSDVDLRRDLDADSSSSETPFNNSLCFVNPRTIGA
ncbi:hypothetical protein C8F01DRAFT_1147585 [Mycena amicta]|nr:hypothetical protein C8F01DRAFT_1147585 [Mycena amicta]